jgi:transposase
MRWWPRWEHVDIPLRGELTVILHREPIGFWAGINRLVTLVEQSMQLDPFAQAVFTFHERKRKRKRKRNRVELSFYDRNDFWMMLRRLEEDHFVWPGRQQTVVKLTSEQSPWLMGGIDIETLMLCAATRNGSIIRLVEYCASPVSIGWPVTDSREPIVRATSLLWRHERGLLLPIAAGRPGKYP